MAEGVAAVIDAVKEAAEVLTGFAIIAGAFALCYYALFGFPGQSGDGAGGHDQDGDSGGGDGGD